MSGINGITEKRFQNLEAVVFKGVIDITVDYYVDSNIVLIPNGNYQQFLISETELNGISLSLNNIDKFLLAKQTNLSENGIYTVIGLNPTLITRSGDFRTYRQIQGANSESVVRIQVLKQGVPSYQGLFYKSSTVIPFLLGTTPIEITETTPKLPLPTSLSELDDVNLTQPINDNVLSYNETIGKWENANLKLNGQEFTGFLEANMEQAFNICDIYPNKEIYEVSAKITSSTLTNTATIFYNQKYSENSGFISLISYFIEDSQNQPFLFFPQNCVNLNKKLQIIIKNNTNELINFQLITK